MKIYGKQGGRELMSEGVKAVGHSPGPSHVMAGRLRRLLRAAVGHVILRLRISSVLHRLGLGCAIAVASATFVFGQNLPPSLRSVGSLNDLVAKAKSEGSLLMYGAPSEDKISEWVNSFTDKYGISVQYYRAPTNPLYQRFSQEQEVGKTQADLIAISDYNVLLDAIKKNWLADYTPADSDLFPPKAIIPKKAYPLYLTSQGIGWNTRAVPADLQEKLKADPFGALLDARLKDKIAIVTVTAGGPQIAQAANVVFNLSDRYGWGYLQKLADQQPAIMSSTTNVLDAVVAGDYWATPDANPSVFAPKAVDGAPIAFRAPDIASATEFTLSVIQNAPHPYSARLFAEWATSLEAQTLLANITESDVTIRGWQDARPVKKLPWYEPTKQFWYGASTDARLQGDNLKEFYRHWLATFRR